MGGPILYPFADVAVLRSENTSDTVDSSYFIIKRVFFLGYIRKKG